MSPAPEDHAAFPAALTHEGESGSSVLRRAYLRLLVMAFTLFNSIRLITYVPTILAIHASGDSGQYSLWTWTMWIGANATMAAWLYENNGRRLDAASAMNAGNALMCAATSLTIVYYRV
jgi:hypothetical protein